MYKGTVGFSRVVGVLYLILVDIASSFLFLLLSDECWIRKVVF